jgi:hypothetical protein
MLCMIVCLGQQGNKIVPDSLTCITPTQVIRHIQDHYILNGQSTSLDLMQDGIKNLNIENSSLRIDLSKKDDEINLHLLQNSNCKSDLDAKIKELKSANSEIIFQKIGLYILMGLAVTELGYIGLKTVFIR